MRIILILIVMAGLYAGWLLVQQNRQEKEEKYWVKELATRLQKVTGSQSSRDPETNEAPLFRLVYFLYKADNAKMDMPKLINEACEEINLDSNAASVLLENLMDDLNAAKRFEVFNDPINLMNLERGDTATIAGGGWKGEKLAVAQQISGLLAPEAAQCAANLVLVPAMVRDAWDDSVTHFTVERAYVLQRAHFISKESYDRIAALKPVPTVTR